MTANPAQRHDIEVFRPLSVPFPPQVVSLVQTCECHPSQWEGWTSDGQAIYVRFGTADSGSVSGPTTGAPHRQCSSSPGTPVTVATRATCATRRCSGSPKVSSIGPDGGVAYVPLITDRGSL